MKRTLVTLALAASTMSTVGFGAATREDISKGINNLGLKTLSQINRNTPKENVFISALSLNEALTMAYAGAEGSTRAELAKLLGLDVRTANEDLADMWKSLREELTGADAKVKFDIANSMWGNKDQRVRFNKDFVTLNKRAHDAEIREEDFQDKAFLSIINGWVSDKTQGKIPSILGGPIPEDQLFYLVNAVYFKGAWATAFDKKNTRDGEFTSVSGEKKQVKMMSRFGEFRHYGDDNVEAVQIPFGTEKRFVMSVYLPAEGKAPKFFSELKASDLEKIRQGFRRGEGSVILPRFKIEYGNEKMVELFQQLGVRQSFTDYAEFPNVAVDEAAKINIIIHKAIVEVNEEGAEAAAATVVGGVRATSISVNLPFVFNANRPFYFEISDEQTQTTLFSGVLNNLK